MTQDVDVVLFEERVLQGGRRLGIATLNSPQTLNGLSLEMASRLLDRFQRWNTAPEIVAIVLRGSGPKAFCAGGDLLALYRSMIAAKTTGGAIHANAYACAFFEAEYTLDHLIRTSSTPVVCWGHGYVMGGGMGMMTGAGHRVVTSSSRLAMPEVTIGLYPDAGGSRLLARIPDHIGRFLSLTGAQLEPGDAIACGFADYYLAEREVEDIVSLLETLDWTDQRASNDALLTRTLNAIAETPPVGRLTLHRDAIRAACDGATLDAVVDAIAAIASDEDPWMQRAQSVMAAGSPGAKRIAWETQQRARDMSWADVYRLEYTVSLHCAAHGDFQEGIRALLIDKDKTPRWEPSHLSEADARWAECFFEAPWSSRQHPLKALA